MDEKKAKRTDMDQNGAEVRDMEKIKISIIVPVYNILEYLPRCVHSLTAQTYRNLEILLVDDGSTDGTEKLCDSLAKEDERIRVFHKKNGGSSSARNLGIREALGSFLGFVDSDDYVEPDMYERMMEAAEAHQAFMVQAGRDEVDAKGQALPDICPPPPQIEKIGAEKFLEELLMHRGDCSFCTKLVARELFKERQFPEGVLNEDFGLLVQMLPEAREVILLPGHSYHVFYRIGSNTRKKSKEEFSRVYGDCVDNADMVANLVAEKYPALKKTALRFGVFQRLEYLLHIPISQMNRENGQYVDIVGWMRRNWWISMTNPFLTAKNKVYHTLFAVAPKGIRVLHKRLKKV